MAGTNGNGGNGGKKGNGNPIIPKEVLMKNFRFYQPTKNELALAKMAFDFARTELLKELGSANVEWAVPTEKIYVLLPYCENVKLKIQTPDGSTRFGKMKIKLPKTDGENFTLHLKVESENQRHKPFKRETELPWKNIKHGVLNTEEMIASKLTVNVSITDNHEEFILSSGKAPKKLKPVRKGRFPNPVKDRNDQNIRTPLWMYTDPDIWEHEEF